MVVTMMNTQIVHNSQQYYAYMLRLSQQRQKYVVSLANYNDQLRALCAGIALDECLHNYGLDEHSVKIRIKQGGKPFLPDYPDIHFNLSHSGHWAVCVIAGEPVGVDIQELHPIHAERLADRFFAPEEKKALEAVRNPQDREALFYRYWTAKESCLKAVGIGLSNLNMVSFHMGEVPVLTKAPIDKELSFREYPIDGYQMTVCSASPTFASTIRYL